MNELRWLECNRHYENIDESKLQNIFYFTLIWNIFEKECCRNDGNIREHPESISEAIHSKVNSQKIDTIFGYFQDRYITDAHTNQIFDDFKFAKNTNDNDYKQFVKSSLLSSTTTPKDKIKSLLYIAFRLRNNLYHGIKEVSKLYEQNENFKQINLFLMEIVDKK